MAEEKCHRHAVIKESIRFGHTRKGAELCSCPTITRKYIVRIFV